MRNAYKTLVTDEYNRFRVWCNDTSVPWPMALGSRGTRLVYSPNGTNAVSPSSVELIIARLLHFEIGLPLSSDPHRRRLHTRSDFFVENVI